MKALVIPLLALVGLSACATNRLSETDRLSLYQAHAGAPVKQMRMFSAIGWDRIDDEHVVLATRPNESWLLTVSGPCLDWGSASPVLRLISQGAYVVPKFDRIHVDGSPMSCRIEEIRPIDVKAVRAAETAMRNQKAGG